MKFKLLDKVTSHHSNHAHHANHMHEVYKDRNTYTDTYQYLDDLLDKTYITDYFMDKGIETNAVSGSISHVSNK